MSQLEIGFVKDNTPLIPDKYPQKELFICDVADAALKDIIPQMEHPFYSLSKKPDTSIRRYEHNGNWLEVIPSVKGLATIYDKDILIYCISQIMEKLKKREPVSQRVKVNSRDLLVFTNRGIGGKDYKALNESLTRLEGTRIRTSIRTGGFEQTDGFGLIDATSVKRQNGLDGRLLSCEIKLSDWVFNAIRAKEVLTLHPDYFRLRKPLERRVYELARKHCGQQKEWLISVKVLHKKSGSKSNLRLFRQLLRGLVAHNHLPDYSVILDHENDNVTFTNRQNLANPADATRSVPHILNAITYEEARNVAPSYDVYFLEKEWKNWWVESGKPMLKNPDSAFIGFCKSRFKMQPNP